jgi:hypothetical protein
MRLNLVAISFLLLVTACATVQQPHLTNVSGAFQEELAPVTGELTRIGIAADSQIQTRSNYALVRGYRGKLEDWAIPVSIRPPALDWAARSLLRSNLERQKEAGAKAIFYLGDGANNGCFDEFAQGFDPVSGKVTGEPNEIGILALLAQFRTEKHIPVFFVIGNHDILGAGSTSKEQNRIDFCADVTGHQSNHYLSKYDVITLTDQFNRMNAQIAPEWVYSSSFWTTESLAADEANIRRNCGINPALQHLTIGCYLVVREQRDLPNRR